MKKLFLVDGSSLIYRTYFALPPLSNSKGEPTGATYGFVRIILNLLEENEIEYIGVTFDKGLAQYRIDKLPSYKENRPKAPDELSIQKERVKEILKYLGIKVLEYPGFEGDDIIGTLTKIATEKNFFTIVVTADRDLLQLLSDKCEVILTKKGITELVKYSKDKFIEEYKIEPSRLPEIKALIGDASDNIPNVPGIGEKTGIKLLQDYKSIEDLFENLPEGKLGDTIKEYKKQILISKEVAKIKDDIILNIEIEDLKKEEIDTQKIINIFSELEFRSLIDKFKIKEKDVKIDVIEKNDLFKCNEISFIGKDDKIIFSNGSGFYIGDKNFLLTIAQKNLYTHSFKNLLNSIYPLPEIKNIFDTELAAYLLNSSRKNYDLATIFPLYLGRSVDLENEYLVTKNLLELGKILKDQILSQKFSELLYEIELPLSYVLNEMEISGVKVDKKKLISIRDELKDKIEDLKREISDYAGFQINPQSPKQVSFLLYEKLGLNKLKKIKTGYSTDQDTLIELSNLHPVVSKIMEFRELNKLLTTYFNVLPELVDNNDRLHTKFIQTGASTGRIISKEPNLQNIPIRTELGKKVRDSFIADEGYILASFDYSQIELRVLAHFSKDPYLIESFDKNIDIHKETAAKLFSVPVENVTEEQRRKAKTINYAILYGMSSHGLSSELKISEEEANVYIDIYFNKFRNVKKFIDEIIEQAKKMGYVETILGRRRYVPELTSKNKNIQKFGERIAINSPIQGSGADIIKVSMINIYRKLKGKKSRIVLQIHDELLVEVFEDEKDEVIKMIKSEMENSIKLDVPVKVEVGIGKTWLECKK
ncbi:MAG: DNA polymerase I [Caldisericia bacterium]